MQKQFSVMLSPPDSRLAFATPPTTGRLPVWSSHSDQGPCPLEQHRLRPATPFVLSLASLARFVLAPPFEEAFFVSRVSNRRPPLRV
jgi:hypothetical protein